MAYNRDRNLIRLAHAYEAISVTATAVGLTAAKAQRANRAFITAETAQMRFRYDGTAPESSEGHLLEIGDSLIIEGTQNLENFKAIKTGATSGALKVTYEI